MRVALLDEDADSESVLEGLAESERVSLSDCERESDTEPDGVGSRDLVSVAVPLAESDAVELGDADKDADGVSELEWLPVGETESEWVTELEEEGVRDELADAVCVSDAECE